MEAIDSAVDSAQLGEEDRVSRKIFRRLIWFLMAMFFCSYLDRINTAFAALSMNRDLGLTASMFGFANTAFYLFYVVAEIPSNVAMARVGARLWIPRIMLTWGLASMATSLAYSATSLYGLRALVGLAEAGFMPGILLFITYWFPPAYRARANTMFIMTQPITIAVGALISSGILQADGLWGLSGWRWLFILEGLPSVVLGVIAFFYLQNRPADARWLDAAEKQAIARALQRQRGEAQHAMRAKHGVSMVAQLADVRVILLALVYVGLVISLSSNSAWVPQIVREVVPHGSFVLIGVITAIPAAITIAVMPFVSSSSDRRSERIWHLIAPLMVAALGWLCVAGLAAPAGKFAGLIMISAGTFAAQGIFWTLPPRFLSERNRPVGMAMVNMIGLLGSIIGPFIFGVLRDFTGSFTVGLVFNGVALLLAAACVLLVSRRGGGQQGVTEEPGVHPAGAGLPTIH